MTPTEHESPDHGMPRQKRPTPTPEQRLAASREAIRMAITRRSRNTSSEPESSGRSRGWLSGLSQVFSHVPMSHLTQRWIHRWWARHPWRGTVEFAVEASDELVRPLAQKHPWLLLGGALGAGVLLSRLRPWRWMSGGALLAGVMPGMPLSAVLDWVTSTLKEMTGHAEASADAAASTDPDAQAHTPAQAAEPPHGDAFTPTADAQAQAPLDQPTPTPTPAPLEDGPPTAPRERMQTLSPAQL